MLYFLILFLLGIISVFLYLHFTFNNLNSTRQENFIEVTE